MAQLTDLQKNWIKLISGVLNGEAPEINFSEFSPQELYKLAEQHSMLSITAFALEKYNIFEKHFQQAKTKALRKLALFDIERNAILAGLNKAEIWHCPLKGVILKELYPEFGMREMSDNDILCDPDRTGDVRVIMEGLGYNCDLFGKKNEDTYSKPPCLEFEMHRALFGTEVIPEYVELYADVFDKLEHTGGFCYRFTDEDFYVYLTAHEYKHVKYGGTGFRSLADTYVFLKAHKELDFEYISGELERLGLTGFERKNRRLAQRVFTTDELSEDETDLLLFFLDSATYGTREQLSENQITKELSGMDNNGAKFKYFFRRFFITGDVVKEAYPFFDRHKFLLPVLWIYRPIMGVITHPKALVRDTKYVAKFKTPKSKF